MNTFKTLAAAAVAVASFADVASAVTVDVMAGSPVTVASVLSPDASVVYTFNFVDDVTVDDFALSATGTNGGADVADVRFGFTQPYVGQFMVTTMGSTAFGGAFLPGGTFMAGSSLDLTFTDGLTNPVGVTVSFTPVAAAVAPVPLPAAGGLLLFAIAGAGAAMRKRKTA